MDPRPFFRLAAFYRRGGSTFLRSFVRAWETVRSSRDTNINLHN